MTETIAETDAPDQETPDEATESPETPSEVEEVSEDTETVPETEEPAQEPEEPSLDAQKNVIDKAQKRAETYVKAVIDVLGDAGRELAACPRCGDFLPGFILPHQIKPVTEEQRVAVKVSMGEQADPSFMQSERASTCTKCDGWGKVLTGSKVAAKSKVTCPECGGDGWIGPLKAQIATAPVAEPAYATQDNGTEPEEKPATDPWGRMRSDPLYGVMPGFEPI